MDKQAIDICALEALCTCTSLSALSFFLYMLLRDPHHMSLGVLPIVFLRCYQNSSLLNTFSCIAFKDLPLNSKFHEGRELSALFTLVYLVQHSAWHIVDVRKCVEQMDCCKRKWLRLLVKKGEALWSLVHNTWPSTWETPFVYKIKFFKNPVIKEYSIWTIERILEQHG